MCDILKRFKHYQRHPLWIHKAKLTVLSGERRRRKDESKIRKMLMFPDCFIGNNCSISETETDCKACHN